MNNNLEHIIINNSIKQIHAEIESDIISSGSIFVFIHPLIFKLKNKKIPPKSIINGIAYFEIIFDFVGKNTVKIYENKELVKEYVFESNNADEFC